MPFISPILNAILLSPIYSTAPNDCECDLAHKSLSAYALEQSSLKVFVRGPQAITQQFEGRTFYVMVMDFVHRHEDHSTYTHFLYNAG